MQLVLNTKSMIENQNGGKKNGKKDNRGVEKL